MSAVEILINGPHDVTEIANENVDEIIITSNEAENLWLLFHRRRRRQNRSITNARERLESRNHRT